MIYIFSPVFPRNGALQSHHLAVCKSPSESFCASSLLVAEVCRSAKPGVPLRAEKLVTAARQTQTNFPTELKGVGRTGDPSGGVRRGTTQMLWKSGVFSSALQWIAVLSPQRTGEGLDTLSCLLRDGFACEQHCTCNVPLIQSFLSLDPSSRFLPKPLCWDLPCSEPGSGTGHFPRWRTAAHPSVPRCSWALPWAAPTRAHSVTLPCQEKSSVNPFLSTSRFFNSFLFKAGLDCREPRSADSGGSNLAMCAENELPERHSTLRSQRSLFSCWVKHC